MFYHSYFVVRVTASKGRISQRFPPFYFVRYNYMQPYKFRILNKQLRSEHLQSLVDGTQKFNWLQYCQQTDVVSNPGGPGYPFDQDIRSLYHQTVTRLGSGTIRRVGICLIPATIEGSQSWLIAAIKISIALGLRIPVSRNCFPVLYSAVLQVFTFRR